MDATNQDLQRLAQKLAPVLGPWLAPILGGGGGASADTRVTEAATGTGTKISALAAAVAALLTMEFEVNNAGTSQKVTLQQMIDALPDLTTPVGLRGDPSGWTSGLYVPWLAGDTLSALVVGDSASDQFGAEFYSGNQPALYAESNSNTAGRFSVDSGTSAAVDVVHAGGGVAIRAQAAAGTGMQVETTVVSGVSTGALWLTQSGAAAGHEYQQYYGTTVYEAGRDIWRVDTADVSGAPTDTARAFRVMKGGVGTEAGMFDAGDSATQTNAWLLYDGTLVRVEVGATDSGGTGYRLLRIPNSSAPAVDTRTTEAGDTRITEAGDTRITE